MRIYPFKAWRVTEALAQQVSCPPYDVIDSVEARSLAKGKPNSFLRVIRPEVDLHTSVDLYADEVYETGAANLRKMLAGPSFTQEETASVYVYRLTMDGRHSTGIFACVGTEDYDSGSILKHELTRPDKEDDRVRHILAQNAHAEPVMLIHPEAPSISKQIRATCEGSDPVISVEADGVMHRIWKCNDASALVKAFEAIEQFYVADGHHRCAAASRVTCEVGGDYPESKIFPAVLFNESEMQIMAYNRVIHKADDRQLEELFRRFSVVRTGQKTPETAGEVCVCTADGWFTIALDAPAPGATVSEKLDVQRLQDQILGPVFDITNPRTDRNISFVGGIRGTSWLEKLVWEGGSALAFSMYPTTVTELIAVSDAGLFMPPKSTWFEPKLRSGLLIHAFD